MWRAVGSQSWTTSPSMRQAAAELFMSQWSVSHACRSSKSVKGYEFQFADGGQIGTLEGEEWRQMYDPMLGLKVPGRMVSSLGRIKNKHGLISQGCLEKSGYYRTGICLTSHRRTELVHRLVAFAFLGPPVSMHAGYVNHKDLDKGNNAAENLEYVTQSENMAHFYAATGIRNSINCTPVLSKLKDSKYWTSHPSIRNAASALGISDRSISRCINRHQASACGYEFMLANIPSQQDLAGEEWRRIDLQALLREKEMRKGCGWLLFWALSAHLHGVCRPRI